MAPPTEIKIFPETEGCAPIKTYDDKGNVLTYQGDEDCDGRPDRDCFIWTHNTNGRKQTEQIGIDCDSKMDECYIFTYYEEGEFDTNNGDTGSDSDQKMQTDSNCDGKPD